MNGFPLHHNTAHEIDSGGEIVSDSVASTACDLAVPLSHLGIEEPHWHDLISGRAFVAESGMVKIAFQPYDVVWLKPVSGIRPR
jgi:hypothetical protein